MGSIQDPIASFYGGYERTNLVRPPLFRIRPMYVALAIAALALVTFIVVDASVVAAGSVSIRVTSVEWETGGVALATTDGFHARPSETFTLTLTCTTVCYRFTGATANAPFQVVAFTTIDSPIQFTNVTIRAPSASYTGPLTIALELPSAPSVPAST
jgi:hypothetical protein